MNTQLSAFDRQAVRAIAESIEQAVQAVGKQYGIIIKRGNGRFDANSFKLNLECTVLAGADERQAQAERARFEMYARVYGLTPGDLGRTFTRDAYTYTITDLSPKSKRFPVICTRNDGKRFKFDAHSIRAALQSQP